MRRTVAVAGLLALVLGFLLGTVVPPRYLPWSVHREPPAQETVLFADVSDGESGDEGEGTDQSAQPTNQAAALNTKENFPLLSAACAVVRAVQERDYGALSNYVHPERGVTFTAFSTVDPDSDLVFTKEQVAAFGEDGTDYKWGVIPGSGETLSMTPEEFISGYMFSADYTQATWIGVDRINMTGNALENIAEAYPGCRFVDFTYPGSQTAAQGQDWSALKLVFAPTETKWLLVGMIHSQWTA